jgi:hypothetical protein
MPATKEYLSCADTAKLVRKALKSSFPGVRFSVRSKTYAGGASINVGWLDGPTTKEVDAITDLYTGATFDGMIDLKSYHDTILQGPDGPRRVRFGANFIFSDRDAGPGLLDSALYRLGKRWGHPEWFDLPVVVSKSGAAWCEDAGNVHVKEVGEYLSTLIHREIWVTSWFPMTPRITDPHA